MLFIQATYSNINNNCACSTSFLMFKERKVCQTSWGLVFLMLHDKKKINHPLNCYHHNIFPYPCFGFLYPWAPATSKVCAQLCAFGPIKVGVACILGFRCLHLRSGEPSECKRWTDSLCTVCVCCACSSVSKSVLLWQACPMAEQKNNSLINLLYV